MKKTLLLLLIFCCLQINAQCWETVAAGYSHTVAVRTDGSLWVCGSNDQGQLGNSTAVPINIPTKMGTANDWKTVAAGWAHTVALKTDGSLWAWGYGSLGQIGNGSFTPNFNPPQQIGTAKDWQTILAGHGHTVALKTDGTLWAWGNNFSGQLGNGTTFDKNIPTQVGSDSDWQTVVAGKLHTVALKKDGTLWAWGKNTLGALGDGTTTNSRVPKQIGTATNWKSISAGSDHTIAIKTDGTLWIWGDNTYGALGDGTTTNKNVPTQIGTSTDWKTVDGGVNYTIAVKTDGSLWAWGFNADGELGNGTKINSLVPVQIGTENNWKMIDGGSIHTVAMKTDESLWTWGSNSLGQLGDGTTTDKNIPTLLNCLGSLILQTSQANINCFGDAIGSASVTAVSGGTAPYTYLWSNGKTTSSITGLTAGEYSCTVTDAASLSIIKSFIITEPAPLNLILTSTNSSCTSNNGNITAFATGGTLPYEYVLSPNLIYQSSNVFAGLSPGRYAVSVRDKNGCMYTSNIVISTNNTPPPTASAQTFNNTATVANLKAVGSNLQWFSVPTGGSALSLSTVLQTGTYYVSQTINGCESLVRASVNVTIIEPSGNEQIPTNGLVAYYPFNGNANDTSGNGANGTVSGASLTSDRFGNSNTAYSFNGVSSYIDAVIPNIPKNNAARTISGWFKTNDAFSDPNKYDATIFNYGTLAKLQRLSLSIYQKGYLNLITGTTSSSDDYYINNFDYSNNDWYFFTITYDGTKLSIYVNGNYVDQKAVNLNTVGNIFRIGQRISGDSVNEGFKGTIDDVAIWNRVLTPEEISAMYVPASTTNYTLIPDSNFEKKLIELGMDSGPVDGKVLTSNISNVKFLDLTKSNISDLTGIQDFVSLTDLYCSQNSLTTVNVSKNTALTTLDCNNNRITSLDVSNNTALLNLSCYSNQLTALDVRVNTALTKLDSGSNKYTALDISSNTALTFLGCNTNQLTSLDVSKNTALNLLDCRENKLTHLDVSKITTLTELYCQSNQLTNLDISKNKALEFLNCSKNQLTTLDVSVNTALVGLYSNSNQLTSLNLKNANNVKFAYLNLTANPNLTCIQVDNAAYSNTNWSTKKDATASYSTNCSIAFVSIPDQNFEQKLIDLGIDTDGLNGRITTANITAVTVLDLSDSIISNLSGIENFTSLTYLDVSKNQLTTLDVSKNLLLETLNASSNQLTTLDLSKNTKLTIVYVANNPLVSLNLRNGNNKNFILPTQTAKKSAVGFYTTFLGLTTLGCIQVDDAAYSDANWSNIKETTTTYSNTCKSLGIDDSVFAKATIYPNPTNGEVNILNITLEKANVYNELGQLVKTFILNSGDTNNTINLSGLSKGVYYIYLINQDAASAKKVIVE
ncbi:putative secreted protein (Por secretion system target) [Flavobacterium chryseum]|uniref:RCC1 domain-containing protein n=1 Tax=Flavobacterium sp. P3160 TaxID=2512113 RepID=UPI00105FD4B9|nr:LamG-like jellyroll fold domain-containing protein [Flavobacterium sp. P3160]TDO83715.1 putative secreted protein (Por secretion system target) [Flavobacterium sp. P3160]